MNMPPTYAMLWPKQPTIVLTDLTRQQDAQHLFAPCRESMMNAHDRRSLKERLKWIADWSEPDVDLADAGTAREALDRIEALEAENARLREALIQHNDRLRSAQMIASRDGADTNWLTFRGQVTYTLAEYHELVNECRTAALKDTSHA